MNPYAPMPWLEAAAAAGLVAVCTRVAWRAGRAAGRTWAAVFAAGMVTITLVALAGHVDGLAAHAPFGWLQSGRARHWLMAAAIPAVLFSLCPRLPRRTEQGLVLGAGLAAALVLGVGPFLLPAALQGAHRRLPTSFDQHAVCRQPTPYTCGPAAAVTAMRRLGIEADLGRLAVEARTAPLFGTTPLSLCSAIEGLHRARGVRCRRTRYASVDELAGPGVHVIELRLDGASDHWAVVDAYGRDGATLADPLAGRRFVSRDGLIREWRARGIVLWREEGRQVSVGAAAACARSDPPGPAG